MGVAFKVDRRTYRFDDFVAAYPPFSAAIDGLVLHEGLSIHKTTDGPYLLCDHHLGNRYGQKACCEQIWEAKRRGDLWEFRQDGEITIDLVANHYDHDGAMVKGILTYFDYIVEDETRLRRTREMVDLESKLDTWIAIYPLTEEFFGRMLYLFEPIYEHQYRSKGHPSESQVQDMIRTVDGRFLEYIEGRGKKLAPWGECIDLGLGEKDWKIVNETGPAARQQMYQDYHDNHTHLYVIHKGELPDGNHEYTVVSPSRDADLTSLCAFFNERDGGLDSRWNVPGQNQWGGNKECFGSQRTTGTPRDPEAMAKLIREFFAKGGSILL